MTTSRSIETSWHDSTHLVLRSCGPCGGADGPSTVRGASTASHDDPSSSFRHETNSFSQPTSSSRHTSNRSSDTSRANRGTSTSSVDTSPSNVDHSSSSRRHSSSNGRKPPSNFHPSDSKRHHSVSNRDPAGTNRQESSSSCGDSIRKCVAARSSGDDTSRSGGFLPLQGGSSISSVRPRASNRVPSIASLPSPTSSCAHSSSPVRDLSSFRAGLQMTSARRIGILRT
jgi:hypothetical protein